MSDLISRQALIEDVRNRSYINKALAEIFETVIDSQSTVYDVDRVVEQLECVYKMDCFPCSDTIPCNKCLNKKAIAIVKAGGVNE